MLPAVIILSALVILVSYDASELQSPDRRTPKDAEQ